MQTKQPAAVTAAKILLVMIVLVFFAGLLFSGFKDVKDKLYSIEHPVCDSACVIMNRVDDLMEECLQREHYSALECKFIVLSSESRR